MQMAKKAYYNSFPLSIADRQENNFVVYPNPVTNMFFVKNLAGVGILSANIYSISGKLVTEITMDNQTTEIALENILPGLYFLKIEFESGVGITKKFIKK
jgi:hypothetical protein